MASKKFQDVELVNAAGDTRTATSPAQFAQSTFDGFYVADDAQLAAAKADADAAAEKAAAKSEPKAPAGKPAPSGNTATGEKTAGTNPS